MKTAIACAASAMLCVGCIRQDLPVPHPMLPHELARPAAVWVVVKTKIGQVSHKMTIPAGWWVASPAAIDADEWGK